MLLKAASCANKSQEFLHSTMGDTSQSLIKCHKYFPSDLLTTGELKTTKESEDRGVNSLSASPISELKQEKNKVAIYLFCVCCINMLRYVLYAMNRNLHFKILYVHIFTYVLYTILLVFPNHMLMTHQELNKRLFHSAAD